MDISNYIAIAVIAIAIFLAIAYYFYRWIFSIKRQLWNQKQQINLLIKIAEKLGASEDYDGEMQAIKFHNNNGKDSELK
jgi:hypothetical protein